MFQHQKQKKLGRLQETLYCLAKYYLSFKIKSSKNTLDASQSQLYKSITLKPGK